MMPTRPSFSPEFRTLRVGSAAPGVSLLVAGALALFLGACSKAPENTPAQKPQDAAKANSVIPVESPLAKAATKGNLTEVKALLDKGASPNVFDALGRTPLHMAAFYGHPRTAALLIARGADVNAKDRIGMTPLHAAVLAGSVQEVDLFLANKGEIDAVANSGVTPLH